MQSVVYRRVDTGVPQHIFIRCLQSRGCTLFALYLCHILGPKTACLPDVDCNHVSKPDPKDDDLLMRLLRLQGPVVVKAALRAKEPFKPGAGVSTSFGFKRLAANILFISRPPQGNSSSDTYPETSHVEGKRCPLGREKDLYWNHDSWLKSPSTNFDAVIHQEDFLDTPTFLTILKKLGLKASNSSQAVSILELARQTQAALDGAHSTTIVETLPSSSKQPFSISLSSLGAVRFKMHLGDLDALMIRQPRSLPLALHAANFTLPGISDLNSLKFSLMSREELDCRRVLNLHAHAPHLFALYYTQGTLQRCVAALGIHQYGSDVCNTLSKHGMLARTIECGAKANQWSSRVKYMSMEECVSDQLSSTEEIRALSFVRGDLPARGMWNYAPMPRAGLLMDYESSYANAYYAYDAWTRRAGEVRKVCNITAASPREYALRRWEFRRHQCARFGNDILNVDKKVNANLTCAYSKLSDALKEQKEYARLSYGASPCEQGQLYNQINSLWRLSMVRAVFVVASRGEQHSPVAHARTPDIASLALDVLTALKRMVPLIVLAEAGNGTSCSYVSTDGAW